MTGQVPGKILLTSNTSWYLWNFRRRLAEELVDHGFEVVWLAPEDAYSDRLRQFGRFIPLELSRKGKNPFVELQTLFRIRRILEREQPGIVLSWTPKLNLYCGIASQFGKFILVPNVAGLGVVFIERGILAKIVGVLYRVAFARVPCVFFQNREDRDVFVDSGWVDAGVARLLPGSGVDVERFRRTPLPRNEPFVFLYAGRLIADKGLPVLIDACRLLRNEGHQFVLRVFGHLDPGNPSGIPEEQVKAWDDAGLIEYRGPSDLIEEPIRESDCVVLPSYYREGVPRILLEAAASARPTITTDSVGCRDAVEDGVTGLVCHPRDAGSLADAMRRMLGLSEAERESMAAAARRLAETKFDEKIVISEYLDAIRQCVAV